MTVFSTALRDLWAGIRAMAGEDAYERYLDRWRKNPGEGGDGAPLSRKAFYQEQQKRKWSGIKRCC